LSLYKIESFRLFKSLQEADILNLIENDTVNGKPEDNNFKSEVQGVLK